jgi:hypothetical protein
MHIFSAPLVIALFVLVLLAIAAASIRLLPKQGQQQTTAGAYEALSGLLTPAERSFFGVLQQALASDFQIFAKVRLADIVKPIGNRSRSGWQSGFNRIASKHVDFVLCELSGLAIVAVIELDDRTHERFDRGRRDRIVDSALADAHIPVLRVAARQSYSPSQIKEQLTQAINTTEHN